jgi:uncharacterized protein
MATFPDKPNRRFQHSFHHRWGFLSDPHVRSLAWLLDAPGLLAPASPQWQGKIGTLDVNFEFVRQWLKELDACPQPLHAWLNLHPFTRLGRYAERLMAFYFTHEGSLVSHGLQVRGANQETIGEFDFLLDYADSPGHTHGNSVLHLELATKFYLLRTKIGPSCVSHGMDYFIGPNLADTLGLKIRKIIDKQLMLGQHPAVQNHLSRQVGMAKALIKGWLFYHEDETPDTAALGLADDHCRGFWCTTSELAQRSEQQYLILPRLSWLAPAKAGLEQALNKERLTATLIDNFQHESMPVLVAIVESQHGFAVETERGFIVPDDWRTRARQRSTDQ